jgi:hypothetical protein
VKKARVSGTALFNPIVSRQMQFSSLNRRPGAMRIRSFQAGFPLRFPLLTCI